jgi:hypothetical protein
LFVLTAAIAVVLALALRNGVDVVATVLCGAFLMWLLRSEVGYITRVDAQERLVLAVLLLPFVILLLAFLSAVVLPGLPRVQ